MHSYYLVKTHKNILVHRLNPCCNGRCTRTKTEMEFNSFVEVLILVVMEDALVPIAPKEWLWNILVLILVVMEDALVL